MPRGAPAILLGGAVLVLVAAALVLAGDRRTLAFVNGVAPSAPAVRLEAGQRACQPGVGVLAPFAFVRVVADTAGRPGPPLEISVLDRRARRTLGAGRVPGGYSGRLASGGAVTRARVGRVRPGRQVEVCVANAGPQAVALGGTVGRDRREARVQVDDRRLEANLHLAFERPRATTLLAELPDALRRAALFHPPLLGAWSLWVLGGMLAFGVPLLLARALASASREGEDGEPPGGAADR